MLSDKQLARRVNLEVWNRLLGEADEIRNRIDIVHNELHTNADLDLQEDLQELWTQYLLKIHHLRTVYPEYVMDFRDRSTHKLTEILVRVDVLYDANDPEFEEMLIRYEKMMDLVNVLNGALS